MDKVKEIKQMLERFYDAQTTEAEEQQLKDYLLGPNVEPELRDEQQFFRQLSGGNVPLPGDLEQHLSRQIDGWNRVEKTTARHGRSVGLRWAAGVAASIVLLVSVTLFVQQRQQRQEWAQQHDTFDDPQDAYTKTQRALTKFSASINKGLNQVNHAKKK